MRQGRSSFMIGAFLGSMMNGGGVGLSEDVG